MLHKKGQSSIFAFFYLGFAILLFIPLLHIYKGMRPHLISNISNPFIVFLVVAFPFIYWVAAAFLFVNTLRGNSA